MYRWNHPAERPSEIRSLAESAKLLSEWPRTCERLHGSRCHVSPLASRPSLHVPDWVIDTQEGCIAPGNSVDKYLALSYVWSSPRDSSLEEGADRLLLRRDTLKDFQTPGFLASPSILNRIPKIIKDALALVRESGHRYLWVDCLCIIQHDETTSNKVALFPEIYSGAYLTIIAASELDGFQGRAISMPYSTTKRAVWLHAGLLNSHWATRGWTFQEQLLSKRSVIFLEREVFWDCQLSVWWVEDAPTTSAEDAEGPYHPADRLDEEPDRDLSHELSTISTPDFPLYQELICRYNHRNLTYAQDALRAFSGVLTAFARGFPGGFISGLPALFLDSVLLWQPFLKAKRRVVDLSSQSLAPNSPLPSWSWIGWQCLIDPKSLQSCLDYKVDTCSSTGKFKEPSSWRVTKPVEWRTFDGNNDGVHESVDEPSLLESYKTYRGRSDAVGLPNGWTSKQELEFESSSGPRPQGKLVTYFLHESQPDTFYRYPLPMWDSSISSANPHLRNVPFLSCTTTAARFRVRRTLTPRKVLKAVRAKHRKSGGLCASIFQTNVYERTPIMEDLCCVVTLEDEEGAWACSMKLMDGSPALDARQTVELIAISRGSCSYLEAASTYEVTVDRLGCHTFNSKGRLHYHFDSSSGGFQTEIQPRTDETVVLDMNTHLGPNLEDWTCGSDIPLSGVVAENRQSGRDLGPLFPPDDGGRLCLPGDWRNMAYEFYNVLWVETVDNISYRRAAGRVPKEIWEKSCGEEKTIILG